MPERCVYLLAAGGHGSVVLDALLEMGIPVAGIVDRGMAAGDRVLDVQVVGPDEWLYARQPSTLLLANGGGATPRDNLRERLFERFCSRGFEFIAIRHPSAVVGRDASLAEGSQLMAGAVVQCRTRIGRNAVVNTRASVDHDCVIGDHAFIGPGATLCGQVTLGEAVFVGAGSVILPGMSVGRRAVVGAGAVVAEHVPDGALVTGVPATRKGEGLQ